MTDETNTPGAHRSHGISRRQLLAGGAGAGGALVAGAVLGHGARAESGEPAAYHLRALSQTAATLYGAMADRVFPSDGTPGATELGFIPYFDGQLAGAWGGGEGFYRHGPFHVPTSSGMGYQLPLVPRDLYAQVATAIDAHATRSHGGVFASLGPTEQDAVMADLEDGKVDLGYGTDPNGFTSALFFADFLGIVNQALFADPMYGGNRDMAGWNWVGFPGDPMAYGDSYWAMFSQVDEPYDVPPKGLQSPGMGYGWGFTSQSDQSAGAS